MHHPLSYDIQKELGFDVSDLFYGENEKGLVWDKFAEEVEKSKAPNVVISSEDFFNLYARAGEIAISKLREKLCIFGRITIIIYLRRQDIFCESSYNQNIKFSKWTGDFVSQMNQLDTLKYNYLEILNIWAKYFGRDNLIVKAFESSSLYGGDVIADFLKILGVNISASTKEYRFNEKIADEFVEFKRYINHVPFPFLNYRSVINEALGLLGSESFKCTPYHMPKEFYRKIVSDSRLINSNISVLYLKNQKLFSEDFSSEDEIIFIEDIFDKVISNIQAICNSVLLPNSKLSKLEPYVRAILIKACLLMCAKYGVSPEIDVDVMGETLIEADRKLYRDIGFFRNQFNKLKAECQNG